MQIAPFYLFLPYLWVQNGCDIFGAMDGQITIALISFVGTVVGSYSGFKLTAYRVEQLEKKVEKHNNFAERIPLMEMQLKQQTKRVDEVAGECDK